MKIRILIILIIIIGAGIGFYLQEELKISEGIPPSTEQLKDLSSVILRNTKFKDFSDGNFSFKYPNWSKIEMDPTLIWPKEIAEKEKILLYLTNPDEVIMLVAKGELKSGDLNKPYPLILREIFNQEREVMEREGGLTNLQIIKEDFFENGVMLESKAIIFGKAITSISKSIILRSRDKGFIYSVGISAPDWIFEDYRALAEYVINSGRYY
ncbi:MAG: hypothetical protein ACE5WD_12575 [Candidatus Aminicenantia bacterium]